MRNLINWILRPWYRFKEQQQLKKRLKELQEQDPFIYK